MDATTRLNILHYVKSRTSPGTSRLLKKFCCLKPRITGSLEISSESTQGAGRDYARLALTCLRREQVISLFAEAGHARAAVEPYMFDNHKDHCFGMGIADYDATRDERRMKLYNYYHLSLQKVPWRAHIRKVCHKAGISLPQIEKDLLYFKKARMSAVDLYDSGKVELKVYFGPFLSRDITGKFKGLFKKRTVLRYKELLSTGHLPDLVLFCARYGTHGRSIRTDFWNGRERPLAILEALDTQGEGLRLYHDLAAITSALRLTFTCVDMDQRPRTQFYFEIIDF